MARIGFIAHYATGHLDPSITLARFLKKQGHEPIFFSIPDTSDRLAEVSLSFMPCGQSAYPVGSLKVKLQKADGLTGATAYAYHIERTMALFRAGFEDLPQLLHKERLDLLVVDQAPLSRFDACRASQAAVYFAGECGASESGRLGSSLEYVVAIRDL